ncbi:MauE/DoxX family redox-associated membrane protein [Streptomyces echinatus]|uniref:MauE/DoxX family redox-associated membrane protein n=1 Tax=Streptomyces echinatus TaxID=67293 RepID=UPI00381C49E2
MLGHVLLGCSILLGVVFTVSTASKVRDRTSFVAFIRSVWQLRLLPDRWVSSVATGVVAAEAVVPVALLVGHVGVLLDGWSPWRALVAAGLGLGLLLLLVFTAVIVRATRQGIRAACRCFGSSGAPLGMRHVVRNVLLAALATTGAVVALGAEQGSVGPLGSVVAAAAGALLALVFVVFDDMVELFVPSSIASQPVD